MTILQTIAMRQIRKICEKHFPWCIFVAVTSDGGFARHEVLWCGDHGEALRMVETAKKILEEQTP